jgi:uncharacterized protein
LGIRRASAPVPVSAGGEALDLPMISRLTVKVVPGASRSKIAGLLGGALKVRVQAPPEKGKANAAVLALLADFLGVPEKHLRIHAGPASSNKVVEVQGLSDEDLGRKLSKLAALR